MSNPRGWRGFSLAVVVAVAFAANSAFAALAYAGGSNALSILTTRSSVAFMILYIFLAKNSVPRALPQAKRIPVLALGLVMAISSYGLLGAVERMPVALAVITVYTYPILVALSGWLSGREIFRPRFAVALFAAFGGLVLALDIRNGNSTAIGIGLASIAAAGVAVLLVMNEQLHDGQDSRPYTLHMLGTVTIIFGLVSIVSGHFTFPHTPSGWIGFIGAPLCYAFAIVFLFVVLSMIGAMRTALIMNIEPVASVILGYLLLAQKLQLFQLLGIALVVGAVIAIEAAKPTTLTSD